MVLLATFVMVVTAGSWEKTKTNCTDSLTYRNPKEMGHFLLKANLLQLTLLWLITNVLRVLKALVAYPDQVR